MIHTDVLNNSYEVLTILIAQTLKDTDGDDSLPNRWEAIHNSTSGVNPVVPATSRDLSSDTDGDGLTLLKEFKANTDPGIADYLMTLITRCITDSDVSSSETSEESFFFYSSYCIYRTRYFFASLILALVVYRVRRR